MTSLACTDLILKDNWPGPTRELKHPPRGGFGGDETNVAVPTTQLGLKAQVYDIGSEGWSTFIYLKNVDNGSLGTTVIGQLCGPDTSYLYRVDQDPDSTSTSYYTYTCGLVAVCTKAMVANYYGWFWCGGVVAQDAKWGCTALAATSVLTNASGVADADVGVMLVDGTGSLMLDTWTGDLRQVGYPLAADA